MNLNVSVNKPLFVIQYFNNNNQTASNNSEYSNKSLNIINDDNNTKDNNPKISKNFSNDKMCYICKSLFQSKYNMERHVRKVHKKLYLQKYKFCGGLFNTILKHQKTCITNNNKLELLKQNNSLLNRKRINESKLQEDNSEHTKSNNNSNLVNSKKI